MTLLQTNVEDFVEVGRKNIIMNIMFISQIYPLFDNVNFQSSNVESGQLCVPHF